MNDGKVNNDKLVNLINNMKVERTNESQNLVISEILRSQFMCPVIIEGAPKGGGKINVDNNTKISFCTINSTDDKKYIIAFTSEAELIKWSKKNTQQSIIYGFEDFAMIVTNNDNIDGFVLDPFGSNIVFNKDMIREIKENVTSQSVVEKDTEVMLGIPENYPDELVEKLKGYFLNINNITSAYLLLMIKNEEKSYLVVIGGDDDVKTHFNSIASAAIPFLNGMPLNLVPYNTDFGKDATREIEPFYKKG